MFPSFPLRVKLARSSAIQIQKYRPFVLMGGILCNVIASILFLLPLNRAGCSIPIMIQAYGDHILYKNAGLTLNKGEHIGIVGQNGAGKSQAVSAYPTAMQFFNFRRTHQPFRLSVTGRPFRLPRYSSIGIPRIRFLSGLGSPGDSC